MSDRAAADLSVSQEQGILVLKATGDWTMASIAHADQQLNELNLANATSIQIDTSAVSAFDTSGAWLIERLRASAEQRAKPFKHLDNNPRHIKLVEVVRPSHPTEEAPSKSRKPFTGGLHSLGRGVSSLGSDFVKICHLIGASIRGPQMKAGKRGGIRLMSIFNQIDHMGWRAIPVIALMSFLIGAIIAQQGAFQLKQFGEELLVVNLVGILHLREIGVLLTAIMVAGRSGSAITAEIGTMKMREEIDALQVIGLNPVGVLIFPRLVALILVLPILTLLADLMGLIGAMVVSDLYVGIPPIQFFNALVDGVGTQHLFVGLIKAPFMAMIIALVAAVEGLKVGGSAESLGQRTTSSVVKSIFVVIVVDGLFAVFYAAIGY